MHNRAQAAGVSLKYCIDPMASDVSSRHHLSEAW
jgi:hypothetical protein